jgi:hypothetical protein
MAILNYTTKVESTRTVSEIQGILGRKGATHVSVDYQGGKPIAVTFGLEVSGQSVSYRLPCNIAGVSMAMKSTRSSVWQDAAQCERIAWRIVKDWVEAQMALVEANQAEVAEVFLPYALHRTGQTLFQAMKSKQLALDKGD